MDNDSKETIKRLSRADVVCATCGSTKFEAMRTIPDQIALICEGCGTSAMLNADDLDGTPVITFMTEEDLRFDWAHRVFLGGFSSFIVKSELQRALVGGERG